MKNPEAPISFAAAASALTFEAAIDAHPDPDSTNNISYGLNLRPNSKSKSNTVDEDNERPRSNTVDEDNKRPRSNTVDEDNERPPLILDGELEHDAWRGEIEGGLLPRAVIRFRWRTVSSAFRTSIIFGRGGNFLQVIALEKSGVMAPSFGWSGEPVWGLSFGFHFALCVLDLRWLG
uniref:Uncharacterized protein n=1 Tax=Fagus sylvatica TaxID=28930 RepID=A0A2N9GVC3_FAGSY